MGIAYRCLKSEMWYIVGAKCYENFADGRECDLNLRSVNRF